MPKIKNKPGPKPKHLKLAGAPGGVAKVDGRTKAGRAAKMRALAKHTAKATKHIAAAETVAPVAKKSGERQRRVLPAINVRVTKEQETFVNKAARCVLRDTGVSKGDWIKDIVFAEAARWVSPGTALEPDVRSDDPEAVPEAAPEQVATPPVSVTPQVQHPVVPLASQLQAQPAQAQAVPPTIRRAPEHQQSPGARFTPPPGFTTPAPILPRGTYPTVPPQLSQPAPGAPHQGYVIPPPNGSQLPEGYEEINEQ